MLDIGLHQAAGLQGFTPHPQLQVVAVASQDEAGSGLETLWQICASLQRLGHPLVVLDGTAQETDDSPGLLHLLHPSAWNDGATQASGARACSLPVIPSARGMLRIGRGVGKTAASPLSQLLPCFRTYGLVVLHAPAAMLSALLTHTATVPLVVMGDGPAGVLAAYQGIKQIALHTGLPCMVAALLRGDTAAERRNAQNALLSLQDCAARHLVGPVRTTTISTRKPQDLQRLALQLLENAGTIDETMPATFPSHLTCVPAHLVRSH
jgi:hypothetical protein